MIADCLAGDRWLSVVMLRPGWEKDYQGRPPVHAVAGAGEGRQGEGLADGADTTRRVGRARVRGRAERPRQRGAYPIVRAQRTEQSAPQPSARARPGGLRDLRAPHARLLMAL